MGNVNPSDRVLTEEEIECIFKKGTYPPGWGNRPSGETPADKQISALTPGFIATVDEILKDVDVSSSQANFGEYLGIEQFAPETDGKEWHPMMYRSPHPYETGLEAAQDFFTSMRDFVMNDKPKRIAWRVKPEIKHQTNFDTFKEEFVIYARLFYLPAV